MRDKIAKWALEAGLCSDRTGEEIADSILALLEPELEKARKWDMVETIAENDCFPCPLKNSKCINCNPQIMRNMIKAIEEEINGTTK